MKSLSWKMLMAWCVGNRALRAHTRSVLLTRNSGGATYPQWHASGRAIRNLGAMFRPALAKRILPSRAA